MTIGYTHALYLLPFDHRHSYVSGMFGFHPPLNQSQHDQVADTKQLIYEGFRQALAGGVAKADAAILVDEEFGATVLRNAARQGYTTALAVEKSGSDEFDFEYGTDFAAHIEAFKPTFAKLLVRYNPEGDAALNDRQAARLKQLSDYCSNVNQRFMFELLVPATTEQLGRFAGSVDAYDLQARPSLMLAAMRSLQDAGVEPDVWKIEGLERREDCLRVVEVARRDGRSDVSCIVLGRGADQRKVSTWVATAATVPGFIGFAVGRTSFWDAVKDYRNGSATRQQASARIAARYAEWVAIFEHQRITATGGSNE